MVEQALNMGSPEPAGQPPGAGFGYLTWWMTLVPHGMSIDPGRFPPVNTIRELSGWRGRRWAFSYPAIRL